MTGRAAPADTPPAESTASARVGQLRSVVWTQLPTLLVGGAAVSAVAGPLLLLTPGVSPLSLLLWATFVSPVFSALVAQANDMVLGREPGTFSLPTYLRRAGRLGLTGWLPAAAAAACLLVAVEVWHQAHSSLALLSAAVGAVVTALLTLAAIAAVPLGVEHPALRGSRLTLTGLHLIAHRPVPVFAVAAFLVAAVSAAVHVAASLLFLIPAPLALVLVVAVWTTAEASGIRPQESEN